MSLRAPVFAFAFAFAFALAGCPSNGTGTDAAVTPMPDAFTPMGEDAPMMMGADAPMMMGADAPMMMGADAPMTSATWGDVHTQLTMRCTPCHVTFSSGGHNMAQPSAAMAYTDSQLTALVCAGMTKGACAAMRVRAGTMPPGGLPEPARSQLADLLDAWVAAGQMGP